MNKKLCTIGLLIILLITAGCQGNKEPSKIIKELDDKQYSILVTFSKEEYFDLEGNKYSEDKKSNRILYPPKNQPKYLLTLKEATLSASVNKSGKVSTLYYSVSDGNYTISLDDHSEVAIVYSVSTLNGSCQSDFTNNEKTNTCDKSSLAVAEKIKKSYQDAYDELGISQQELVSSLNWITENKIPDIKTKVQEQYDSQVPLTNKLIEDAIINNGYLLTKSNEGHTYIRNAKTKEILLSTLKDEQNHTYALQFNDTTIASQFLDSCYTYYFDASKEFASTNDGQYAYDFIKDKEIGESKENSFKNIALILRYKYFSFLTSLDLSDEEMIQFLKKY